jgi:hypothetical protein
VANGLDGWIEFAEEIIFLVVGRRSRGVAKKNKEPIIKWGIFTKTIGQFSRNEKRVKPPSVILVKGLIY